jgi:Right handed beta helix region
MSRAGLREPEIRRETMEKQHKPAIKSSAVVIASRMKRLQPLRMRAVFAAGFAAVALALFATPSQALMRCSSTSISSCCRITRSGDYVVTQPLTTSSGSCLVIAARNVELELRGESLTGGGTSSGIGLDALSSASHLIVAGEGSRVTKFGTGVRNDAGAVSMDGVTSDGNGIGLVDTASNAVFSNLVTNSNANQGALFTHASKVRVGSFQANSNGGDGAVLNAVRNSTFQVVADSNNGNGLTIKGGSSNFIFFSEMTVNKADGAAILNSTGNTLYDLRAEENTGNGITIKGGSGNSIVDAEAGNNHGDGVAILNSSRNTVQLGGVFGNAGVGLHIGCQPSNMPVGSACRAGGASSDNVVDELSAGGNGWGIVIDNGNHRNRIVNNTVLSNTNADLIDDNADCDSNLWIQNTFGSGRASPPCVD